MADLSFAQLRRANTERCAPPWFRETIDEWSPCDWVTALVGEVGEAANLIKKVHRGDFQIDDPLPNDLQKRTVRQAIAKDWKLPFQHPALFPLVSCLFLAALYNTLGICKH